MIRQIQSPGIEIHEIDKSQYNREDYSLVGTTTLVCGFADKGPDFNINWINSVQYLQDVYGVPTTEEERYFYNACIEILQKGGVLLGAKLPYNNKAQDHYACVKYTIDKNPRNLSADLYLRTIQSEVDTTLSTYISINGTPDVGYIDTSQLDQNLVASTGTANEIRIIDITHSPYEQAQLLKFKGDSNVSYTTESFDSECVGIVPVITTALNAIYFQKLLPTAFDTVTEEVTDPDTGEKYLKETTTDIEGFNPISDFGQINDDRITFSKIQPNNFIAENFAAKITDESINTFSVAVQAVDCFPTLAFSHEKKLDKTYLKQIGVVVFKIYKDNTVNDKLNFRLVESFVGSLDRLAQDPLTKSTLFIDNIVNSQSQYIRLFSTIRDREILENVDTFMIKDQVAASLGLKKSMLSKVINLTRLYSSMNTILDTAQDKNRFTIDIVVDAGLSNIALKASGFPNELRQYEYNCETEAFSDTADRIKITSSSSVNAWRTVIQKFTNFCGKSRKDCIFLADSPKQFGLEKDQKIIRRSKPSNTIEKDILPKLRYISPIDSSYAAGYCDWFLGYDAYSGNSMWIPPSIKAAGIYVYTDIYYNKWDAPAGMTRGVVKNVVDCAFSPSQVESDRIYIQGWNYAVNYPMNGIVIEGQKTFQKRATAFDRINVRRLFLYLERQVSNVAKYFVYEGNTAYQRSRFVDMIRPYFDNAVQRGGILEYYIQCDETNNTPQVIDNNEMRCTIAVKPVKSIEFIILNFICTNQSANVTEIVTAT